MMPKKMLNYLFFSFGITILILFSFLYFLFSKPIEIEKLDYKKKEPAAGENEKSIAGGSLYLSPFRIDISNSSIKEQLEIYFIEPRFDLPVKKDIFEVKFKNSIKTKKICAEDKLYLAEKQNDTFDFSDEKTALSLQIVKLDKENARVLLEGDLKEFNIYDIDQVISESFILPMSDLSLNSSLDDKLEFKVLMSGKWLGIDHFLSIRNKEESGSQKERLEIDGNILYVDEKSILIFKDCKWTIASANDNTLNYPIAKIKSTNAKSIEIEAWDVQGNSKYSFSVFLSPQAPFLAKSEQLITSAKKRTNTHISCMFDKQRLILKEKDILIKKDNRWKVLKKDVVIDDIINEELFYFEKIEEKNSKKILIGYLFNIMRTNFQKIEVPIISFTNQKRLKKR